MHDTHEHKHEHIDPNKKTLELLKKKKEEEEKKKIESRPDKTRRS